MYTLYSIVYMLSSASFRAANPYLKVRGMRGSLQTLHARIGDSYLVKTTDGRSVPVVFVAEFQEEGAFQGPQIIISQDTLATIPGTNGSTLPAQYSTIYTTVLDASLKSVQTQVSQNFPTATLVTAQDLLQRRQTQVDQIRLFLRIVGLLEWLISTRSSIRC